MKLKIYNIVSYFCLGVTLLTTIIAMVFGKELFGFFYILIYGSMLITIINCYLYLIRRTREVFK